MKRGFTLFEILLVLFVMSMLVIGGIQLAQRKQEKNAAQQLGQRLYQYGIAVAEYARQNPDQLADGDHEIYGIEWLKAKINPETCTTPDLTDPKTCETFLGKNYNLKFPSLLIANLQGDPDATDDQTYTKLTRQSGGELKVDLVELGTVYRHADAAAQSPYEVDLSLPGDAATVANEYTQEFGNAKLIYTVESLDSSTNIHDIHIVGGPNTSTPNVDSGYLRTDGTNEMDGDIKFATAKKGIEFEGGARINTFMNLGNADSNFSGSTRNDGNQGNEDVTGVPQPPSYTWGDFSVFRQQQGVSWAPLARYTVQNSVCFLSGMQKTGNSDDVCRVIPVGTGPYAGSWALYLDKGTRTSNNPTACYARCLVFNQ